MKILTMSDRAKRMLSVLGLRRPPLADDLRRRPQLSVPELKDLFYSDLKVSLELFSEIWSDIATAFQIPAGLIRPTDRFGQELRYWRRFGMTDEDLELSFALTRRLKRAHGRDTSLPELRTVDDYVRFVAAAVEPGSGSESGGSPS